MESCSCNIHKKTKDGDRLSAYHCLINQTALYNCSPQKLVHARALRNLLVYNLGHCPGSYRCC